MAPDNEHPLYKKGYNDAQAQLAEKDARIAVLKQALAVVASVLRQRHQDGWESRLLDIVDTAIDAARP